MADPIDNEAFIHRLADSVTDSYRADESMIKIDESNQIGRDAIVEIIRNLRGVIFPGFFRGEPLRRDELDAYVRALLEKLIGNLEKQISRALLHHGNDARAPELTATEITRAFLERLPQIRALLATDIDAAFDGDPAAFNRDEIILSYPGLFAITVSRLSHELYLLGVPLIPRMMSEYAHSLTGIDIHPGASIGHHFFIDHGTGIVIGETTEIGNFVKIYQGVTLGALSTRGGQVLSGVMRHPTIEDHVTIYSGASILGGMTLIGEGVVIGSNAFITKSVPEKTRVSVKNPELQFKSDERIRAVEHVQEEFWDFVI
ncbi:MAG: serine acetyltransferase [Oscillospiraceae bacterium]|jgi:serine O-acetyltransferase|nr:serine acetyltransferase [Oscillospiraceae bacterium]